MVVDQGSRRSGMSLVRSKFTNNDSTKIGVEKT